MQLAHTAFQILPVNFFEQVSKRERALRHPPSFLFCLSDKRYFPATSGVASHNAVFSRCCLSFQIVPSSILEASDPPLFDREYGRIMQKLDSSVSISKWLLFLYRLLRRHNRFVSEPLHESVSAPDAIRQSSHFPTRNHIVPRFDQEPS